MKRFAKLALGAVLMAGAATAMATPADARVSIGIGIGVPGGGYYGPAYRYNAYCDPYSPYYDPYDCRGYGPSEYWYDPVFIGGEWFYGPHRYREWGGRREFWVHGGWHHDEWRGGARPDWRGHGDWHDRGRGWHDHDWHH
jgi:hypothetical protein